jgi:ABC-type phosphate/phosphonate transport system substrate-binding protein
MTGGAPVAAPPMYDFPEIEEANDALWRRIRAGLEARGIEAPERLTRGAELAALWRSPNLVFGQTCGYPLVTALGDAVALVATPIYSFPGCDGATHRSFVVRRARDPRRALTAFRGAVAAVNAGDSNTGMNLFRATIAPLAGGRAFFSDVVVTGSHAASLEAIAEGRADLAAIDCVTYGLLKRIRPGLVDRAAIIAKSPPSPGLPFIACARLPGATIAAVRDALFEALADPHLADTRRALGLAGARPATAEEYRPVMEIERSAAAVGYATLA